MAMLRNAAQVPKKQPAALRAALLAGFWTVAGCAAMVIAGCALWMAVGMARDGWFHQITLYPALCDDSECRTWHALPRIRYRVEVGNGDVYFWTDPLAGSGMASASGGLFRMSNCSIFDRGTWTCWAKGRSDIVSFYDGRPVRVEILPLDARLVSVAERAPETVRFLDRTDWYLAQYAPSLVARR